MLLASYFGARYVINRFEIQRGITSRLGLGLFALGLLLAAELFVVLSLRGMSLSDYIHSRDPISGMVYLTMLGIFTLMPVFVQRPA
jgi:hypothetical protein